MPYSEPCPKMKDFVKICNGLKSWTIFAKSSISDVWRDSEYIKMYFQIDLTEKEKNYIKGVEEGGGCFKTEQT